MSVNQSGVEICPYCKKPFKRLKSHLPYCKMASLNEGLTPTKKSSSSAVPTLLNTEKKKGQVRSKETAPKKENKKSKPEVGRDKMEEKAMSSNELAKDGTAKCRKGTRTEGTEIKRAAVKTHRTKSSSQNASDVQPQPAEEVGFESNSAVKLSRLRKSRIKPTSDGEAIAPYIVLEPNIQHGKSTSELPGLPVKWFSDQSLSEDTATKQNALDSSVQDLLPVPQETDRIKLTVENHCLRKKRDSSVQHEVTIADYKTGCVKLSPGTGDTVLANGQQVTTVTGRMDGESILGCELAGNILGKGTGTTTEAHRLGEPVLDTCTNVSSLPVLLPVITESRTKEKALFFKEEGYHKESPVCTISKSKMCPSITETLRLKGDKQVLNSYLTQLEKDITLHRGTAVALDYKNSGMVLRQPSIHSLEITAGHRLSPLDRGPQQSSLGLEWFPELYLNYQCLFSRKQPPWDTPIAQGQVLPCKDQQASLAERCLMEVRLQDLPDWLVTRNLSPKRMFGATYRACNSYYNKYLHLKKNGMAGISMLFLGCYIVRYAWSYEHIKHSRWRTYH